MSTKVRVGGAWQNCSANVAEILAPGQAGVAMAGAGRMEYSAAAVDLSDTAYTMMILWRPLSADGVSQALLSGETAAGKAHWILYRLGTGFWTTNSIGLYRYWLPPSDNEDMVWTTTLSTVAADALVCTFASKPAAGGAGNEPYVSQYKRSGSAWVHDTSSPARMNFQLALADALGIGGKIVIGSASTERLTAEIYCAAIWEELRTNHDALMASHTTAALLATSPRWAVDGSNDFATDLTGNGGNLLSSSGIVPTAPLDPSIWGMGA